MHEKRLTFLDKSHWGDGPWKEEPDKVQWVDDASGLACLIVRADGELGHLCGYVGVPEGHPFFGKDYDDIDVSVHGGVTFTGLCQETAHGKRHPEHRVCHTPEAGMPDRVWWIGFDCAHAGDLSPGIKRLTGMRTYEWESYKDIAYVQAQCAELAGQLAAAVEKC